MRHSPALKKVPALWTDVHVLRHQLFPFVMTLQGAGNEALGIPGEDTQRGQGSSTVSERAMSESPFQPFLPRALQWQRWISESKSQNSL